MVLHDAGAESVDAPAWDMVAEHRPICQVMLPGVEGSTDVPDGADITWMTGLLADVLVTLGAPPTTVVGTSLGGWFALETALAHPALVQRLVLLDTAGLHSPPGYLFGLFADGQGQGGHDELLGPTMRNHRVPDHPAAIAPYLADLTAAALHSWSPHLPDPSLLTRARQLTTPTTILWGADDALIPVAHGRALAEVLPNATLEVVTDAGHLLAVDAPALVAARILGRPVPSGRHAT